MEYGLKEFQHGILEMKPDLLEITMDECEPERPIIVVEYDRLGVKHNYAYRKVRETDHYVYMFGMYWTILSYQKGDKFIVYSPLILRMDKSMFECTPNTEGFVHSPPFTEIWVPK